MTIILLLWWPLGHGNRVVPSSWQATTLCGRPRISRPIGRAAFAVNSPADHRHDDYRHVAVAGMV